MKVSVTEDLAEVVQHHARRLLAFRGGGGEGLGELLHLTLVEPDTVAFAADIDDNGAVRVDGALAHLAAADRAGAWLLRGNGLGALVHGLQKGRGVRQAAELEEQLQLTGIEPNPLAAVQ